MKKLKTMREALKEEMKDPEFKKAFDQEEIYASLAINVAKLRETKNLSQAQLARKLHTTQQTISRLESQNNESISIRTLVKIADAFDQRLEINFFPYKLKKIAA
jgi:DNA-binding XRE family transcriptional regulator